MAYLFVSGNLLHLKGSSSEYREIRPVVLIFCKERNLPSPLKSEREPLWIDGGVHNYINYRDDLPPRVKNEFIVVLPFKGRTRWIISFIHYIQKNTDINLLLKGQITSIWDSLMNKNIK